MRGDVRAALRPCSTPCMSLRPCDRPRQRSQPSLTAGSRQCSFFVQRSSAADACCSRCTCLPLPPFGCPVVSVLVCLLLPHIDWIPCMQHSLAVDLQPMHALYFMASCQAAIESDNKRMEQDGWGSQELLPDFELAGRRCHWSRLLLLLLPRCGHRFGCCEHRSAALLLLCLPQENVPQAAWCARC